MLLLRSFALLALLMVSACGFQPLHGNKSANKADVSVLHKITIKVTSVHPEDNRAAQILQTELEGLFNPLNKPSEKKYALNVKLSKKQTSLAIQQDATVTSYRLFVNADYELISKDDRKVLKKDSVKNFGGFDQVDSQYATITSERYGLEQLLKEAARRLKLQVIADLN